MPGGERLLVLAGAAAGAVLALGLTLALPSDYLAETSIALARPGQPPGVDPELAAAAAAAAELFESRTVAESASRNLGLDGSVDDLLERIDAKSSEGSALVRVEVEAPTREEARRTAQEVSEVATVLFNERYGQAATAAIWDAPRVEEREPEHPARNVLLGALAGALVGAAASALGGRSGGLLGGEVAARRPEPVPAEVDRRVAAVTARELALARRSAALAVRERELAAADAPPPVVAVPPKPFEIPVRGAWTLADVERLVALYGVGAGSADEIGYYVESLRLVADDDGRLPTGVEAVIADVFHEQLRRARE
jgi:capsular polysaccharide biosynthesis protein